MIKISTLRAKIGMRRKPHAQKEVARLAASLQAGGRQVLATVEKLAAAA